MLRNKPIAVAAYDSPGGCIVAPSIEAKKLGIKTGMRVREGKIICPSLIVLLPDPQKYRFINRKLLVLLQQYSLSVFVRSIDEMVVDFTGSSYADKDLSDTARKIKTRIRQEIGEYLIASVGIAPNRFWAKLASSLKKPDGLVTVNTQNVSNILSRLKLSDIHGIKSGNIARLQYKGIFSPMDFYNASPFTLKQAFGGITGYYWHKRLHGYEIDSVEFPRRSFGNSYALYKAEKDVSKLSPILCKLVEKMGRRLRLGGYTAQGIHLSCLLSDYSYWHHGEKTRSTLYSNSDLYQQALRVLQSRPAAKPVRILAVSCYYLQKNLNRQLSILDDESRKYNLTSAVDSLNLRYGDFVVSSARMAGMDDKVLDRIAFGGIKELEEFIAN